jgi:hypothetical protein
VLLTLWKFRLLLLGYLPDEIQSISIFKSPRNRDTITTPSTRTSRKAIVPLGKAIVLRTFRDFHRSFASPIEASVNHKRRITSILFATMATTPLAKAEPNKYVQMDDVLWQYVTHKGYREPEIFQRLRQGRHFHMSLVFV